MHQTFVYWMVRQARWDTDRCFAFESQQSRVRLKGSGASGAAARRPDAFCTFQKGDLCPPFPDQKSNWSWLPRIRGEAQDPFWWFLHQLVADFPNKTSPLKNHLNHILSQFLMVRNGTVRNNFWQCSIRIPGLWFANRGRAGAAALCSVLGALQRAILSAWHCSDITTVHYIMVFSL